MSNDKPNDKLANKLPTGFSVFGVKPKDSILVPESPIVLRNNCQSGQWTMGDMDMGSKLVMSPLKFSRFWGDLGQTKGVPFGQIWFVAEEGSSPDIPLATVMVTYVKSRNLSAFSQMVTTIQARGVEPATGLFIPEFVKQSGQKPDDNGIVKPINYYTLKWLWKERTAWSSLDRIAAVLADPSNQSRMIDLESTRHMICLDSLSAQEAQEIVSGAGVSALNPGVVKALPG